MPLGRARPRLPHAGLLLAALLLASSQIVAGRELQEQVGPPVLGRVGPWSLVAAGTAHVGGNVRLSPTLAACPDQPSARRVLQLDALQLQVGAPGAEELGGAPAPAPAVGGVGDIVIDGGAVLLEASPGGTQGGVPRTRAARCMPLQQP